MSLDKCRAIADLTIPNSLTQASTQEAYRDHISERIIKAADQHGKLDASTLFPWPVPGQQAAQAIGRPMMATLTDVLLLVRRLREGCVAAKRADHFAIDGELCILKAHLLAAL